MIPTKLNVFNRQFDVNTPQFIKECCENVTGGMYPICWNIFKNLIAMVAERATEINDPIMNVLMIRLGLYDMPKKDRSKMIEKIKEEVEKEIQDKKI